MKDAQLNTLCQRHQAVLITLQQQYRCCGRRVPSHGYWTLCIRHAKAD